MPRVNPFRSVTVAAETAALLQTQPSRRPSPTDVLLSPCSSMELLAVQVLAMGFRCQDTTVKGTRCRRSTSRKARSSPWPSHHLLSARAQKVLEVPPVDPGLLAAMDGAEHDPLLDPPAAPSRAHAAAFILPPVAPAVVRAPRTKRRRLAPLSPAMATVESQSSPSSSLAPESENKEGGSEEPASFWFSTDGNGERADDDHLVIKEEKKPFSMATWATPGMCTTSSSSRRKRSSSSSATERTTTIKPSSHSSSSKCSKKKTAVAPKGLEEEASKRKRTPPKSARRYTAKSSSYVGVSFYKRVERWEAHIWAVDKNKQIYIGSSSTPEAAARIYDRAYIKFRGENCPNFPYSDYVHEMPQWINLPGQDFIKMLRNMSRGDSLLWLTPEHLLIVSGIPNDKTNIGNQPVNQGCFAHVLVWSWPMMNTKRVLEAGKPVGGFRIEGDSNLAEHTGMDERQGKEMLKDVVCAAHIE
ncbi:hypothetical protein SELMODRAFT_419816 [Selaginella moellendorffii]|uniref:AP2/ERF domain-containing protein n=1 Tax=Selaginella moellendorffii TaxID=88036 RepID=D8SAM8_SELML|nr:hypothetical protein SELMODRAFT_419816 [Selaginella moellendorffii]